MQKDILVIRPGASIKIIRVSTVAASLRILLKGQLRFMSNYFEVVGISSGGPDLDKLSTNEGIRVGRVDMTRKITPVKDVISLFKLYRTFVNEKPVIVHTHTPKAGLLGMIAAKLSGVPLRLHTVAGMPLLESKGIKRLLLQWMERLTYHSAHKVYPNSKVLKGIILDLKFCNSDKLKVIGNGSSNGIDTSFFDPGLYSVSERCNFKDKLGIASDEVVFCFVGRIVADKGIKELVHSFDECSKLYPKIRLLLVGSYEVDLDPIDSRTQKIIKSHSLILSVGFQDDIRPYLSISNIFVFPSYREGFPNVVLQASAMGLPCIVSDINGCNEIIENGKNGIVIPVKSSKALLNAMVQLLNNPTEIDNMSKLSRVLICEKYEQEVVWNGLLEEYFEQLNSLK